VLEGGRQFNLVTQFLNPVNDVDHGVIVSDGRQNVVHVLEVERLGNLGYDVGFVDQADCSQAVFLVPARELVS
jgi:hypothetical protein